MSDPPLSDIDFKWKMACVWITFKVSVFWSSRIIWNLFESASNGAANTGHAAKKIIELGKKTRSITTELESEKTKTRQLEKEKRILENKNSQLASKLAQANIEASGGDAYSMSSFAQERIQCAP